MRRYVLFRDIIMSFALNDSGIEDESHSGYLICRSSF